MRYSYWILRYLPDAGRGEFVNIGLLVGRDGADWAARTVESFDRASRLGGSLDSAKSWAHSIESLAAREVEALSGLVLSEHTVHDWVGFHNNVVQLSAPLPVVAESAEAAIDLLYPRLVLEHEKAARSTSHYAALAKLEAAYNRIRPDLALTRKVKVRAGKQTLDFDFALSGPRVEEVSRVWAFDLKETTPLVDRVLAWGFKMHELRSSGGEVRGPNRLEVARDVPVKVLYVPPRNADQIASFEVALDAWKTIGAVSFPVDRADQLARAS
ncbi:DUF3037 domain-containing protein [Rhodococcus sp. NPDC078407]|uniref:DUF3037 domain-containing protein n=1 Tax=Rhodococcus sp. NPDC078407 TaxID=3364509 RepID=UPI0037CBB207